MDENPSSSDIHHRIAIPFESDIFKVEMASGAYRSHSRSNGVKTTHFSTTRNNCSWTIENGYWAGVTGKTGSGVYVQADLKNVRSKNCVGCQCASLAVGSVDQEQMDPFNMNVNASKLNESIEWKTKLCGENISTDSKLLVKSPSSMVLNLDFDRSKFSRFSIEFSIKCKLYCLYKTQCTCFWLYYYCDNIFLYSTYKSIVFLFQIQRNTIVENAAERVYKQNK